MDGIREHLLADPLGDHVGLLPVGALSSVSACRRGRERRQGTGAEEALEPQSSTCSGRCGDPPRWSQYSGFVAVEIRSSGEVDEDFRPPWPRCGEYGLQRFEDADVRCATSVGWTGARTRRWERRARAVDPVRSFITARRCVRASRSAVLPLSESMATI